MNIQIEGIIQYLAKKPSRLSHAFSGGFKSNVCENKWVSAEIQLSEEQYLALSELNKVCVYKFVWEGSTMDVWRGEDHVLKTLDN